MPVDLYFPASVHDHAQALTPWCVLHPCQTPPTLTSGHALWLDREGLALLSAEGHQLFRLTLQMLDARRRGKSLLAQACGIKRRQAGALRVLDAFAGFGLDALTLADLGCEVTAIEQQPLIWLLLDQFVRDVGLPVQSQCADALQVMAANEHTWDIIYLDPMFSPRRKRALPNVGLQHLQALSGDKQVDVQACLALAINKATLRVVLKRRRKDPVIGKPSHQLKGQAVRFDVYVNSRS